MKKYLIFALSVFSAFVIGCGDRDEFVVTQTNQNQPAPITPPPAGEDKARLRIVNPSSTHSNLRVSVDGTVVDADLDAQESTRYLEFSAGSHTITVSDGTNNLADHTITLVKDGYHSSVFLPSPEIANQTTTPTPALFFLTDNVTPTAGTLRARLVYASRYDGQITLFNDSDVRLLGPTSEATASDYVTLGASAASSANFQALIQNTGFADLLAIFTQESNGDGLVRALVKEIGQSGANVTLFVNYHQPLSTAYATALLDEADDGSRSILSSARTQFVQSDR